MPVDETLTFAVLVGSLRKGSYNAAVARALPALAPDGVTIAPLDRSANFRSMTPTSRRSASRRRSWRWARRSRRRTASSSSVRNIISPSRAFSRTPSTGFPVCPRSRSSASRSRSERLDRPVRRLALAVPPAPEPAVLRRARARQARGDDRAGACEDRRRHWNARRRDDARLRRRATQSLRRIRPARGAELTGTARTPSSGLRLKQLRPICYQWSQ